MTIREIDVLREAAEIKQVLARLGWRYVYGGPYPENPTLHFVQDNQRLHISLSVEAPSQREKDA
ncbi:hypothetical protein [Frigidibacter oleivorans]|uniref:hypothetical protein n=1 Tax=Frigidibacter oleivorans TaxID=2487129 RepID=UPI000F8CF0A1|nr:hypothetical protein [Frigidibacter oleivorans]